MWVTVEGTCGSFGCTLPRGHNQGKADIPENHQISAWKRGELGDVKAALMEIQDLDTRLHERALRAYERYGIPAPLVVWAAQRAWAQGTPHLFAVILMNHIEDCYRRLPKIVHDSMIL